MSWKHLFKTARKLGAPIIVTNEEAKDPMVIMPLSAYEDLAGDRFDFEDLDIDMDEFAQPAEVRMSPPDIRTESAFEFMSEPSFELPDLPEESQKIEDETLTDKYKDAGNEVKQGTDFSLEDRFYFEPLDDDSKK